jgi:hypothetical protein
MKAMTRRDVASRAALWALMLVVAVLAYEYRFISFVEFSNDDFLHLAMGQQIARGALPVRDFVERGLPLMSFVSAFGQMALGEGLKAELEVVSAAYAVTAALALFVAARVSGSLLVGLAMALLLVFSYPVSYSYPKLLPYAIALAAAWAYGVRPSLPRLAALAAAVVCGFLFRHDHGVILGAGAAAGVGADAVARHGFSRPSLVEVGRFTGIALLLVAPYLVWVQVYEGLGTYVSDGIAFSGREAEKATWGTPPPFGFEAGYPLLEKLGHGPVVNVRWSADLDAASVRQGEADHGLIRLDPVGPAAWQYELSDWSPAALERLVKDRRVGDTHHIDRSAFQLQEVTGPEGLSWLATRLYGPGRGMRLQANAIAGFYYLVWLLPVAAAVALAVGWRSARAPVRVVIVMAVLVQFAMDMTMLRDPLANRIREVLVPMSVLAAFLAAALWRMPGRRLVRVAGRVLAVAAVCGLVAGAASLGEAAARIGSLQLSDGVEGLSRRSRSVRYRLSPPQHRTGDRLTPAYTQLVSYIRTCTPPGSRLFVMTFAPEIFIYADREFAGGQVAMTPGYFVTGRHAALMVERLSREDVPLVILDSQTRAEMAAQYPRVMEYVFARYHDVGRFPMGSDKHLDVLAENRRAVRRNVGDGGFPCFL